VARCDSDNFAINSNMLYDFHMLLLSFGEKHR
jgi:hypothetical protein